MQVLCRKQDMLVQKCCLVSIPREFKLFLCEETLIILVIKESYEDAKIMLGGKPFGNPICYHLCYQVIWDGDFPHATVSISLIFPTFLYLLPTKE